MISPRLRVAAHDADRAAEALYRAGYLGAFEEDRGGEAFLVAVFESAEAAALARDLLSAGGIASRFEEAEAPADPFAPFRGSLSPFRIGRFWIDPREVSSDPPEGGITALRIPAHCAFGTGLHESTRGILQELDGADLAGAAVLDAGCGSAILAIAAVKRGARRAVGFDTDAEALFEARRNLRRNGVRGGVLLFAGGIEALHGAFGLVMANMIWEELSPILPALAGELPPGGAALFSGILDQREEVACAALRAAGFAIAAVAADGEWRTIRAIRS